MKTKLRTMSKPLSVFLFLSLFTFATACKKSGPAPSSNAPAADGVGAPTPIEYHAGGGTTPALPAKYFKGSIGDSLDLQMKLMRNGDQLTGSYSYTKVGTKIDLRGRVDKDGNLTLEEFDPNGKQTGVFQGLWKTDGPDGPITIAGNWSNGITARAKTSIVRAPGFPASRPPSATGRNVTSNRSGAVPSEAGPQYPTVSPALANRATCSIGSTPSSTGGVAFNAACNQRIRGANAEYGGLSQIRLASTTVFGSTVTPVAVNNAFTRSGSARTCLSVIISLPSADLTGPPVRESNKYT